MANPVQTIAVKEFKSAFRDWTFIFITLVFLVLSIVSVYIGSSTKNAEIKAYSDIVQLLKSQGAKLLPQEPIWQPLAVLKNMIVYIGIVGAVLSVFLGFDTFTSERDNGTIKLLLSRPVKRSALVSGKILGGAFVIGSLLLTVLIFNTLLFMLVSGLIPDSSELLRLFLFTAVSFVYMMTFYLSAVFVSILADDRTLGFLVMLIVWLTVSFVIPQLSDTVKNYSAALASIDAGQPVVPADTILSKIIEAFSPDVQFQNITSGLLQTSQDSAGKGILELIVSKIIPLVLMLIPGLVLLPASYQVFQKKEF